MNDDAEQAEHDRLYREGTSLVLPLILLDGKPTLELTAARRVELQRGMALLEQVVGLNEYNWPAMYFIAKGYQRLEDFDGALQWYEQAYFVNPTHREILREASIAAMELRRLDVAVRLCREALQVSPNDPGLQANLALAMLFSGDAQGAAKLAEAALRRDPSDDVTRRIVDACRDVLAGVRPCPKHVRDLD